MRAWCLLVGLVVAVVGLAHGALSHPLQSYPPPAQDPNMSAAVAAFVDTLIKENVVTVFSKSYCPYCTKAKNALANYAIKSYKVVELDQRQDGDAIQDYMLQLTKGRSVPRVFIGGKFFGGGDDTAAAHANGQLKTLLEQAGAL